MDRRTTSRTRRWTRRLSTTVGSFGVTAALLMGSCQPQCAPAPAPAPAPPPLPTSDAVQQVVDLTNTRRAESGLGPVTVHGALDLAAQSHADTQAARGRMGHDGSDGSNPGQRIAATGYQAQAWGENVGYGYPDAAAVVAAWMNSQSHRATILNATYTEIGVGLAYGSGGTPYWTMVVAHPA